VIKIKLVGPVIWEDGYNGYGTYGII